MVFPPVIWESMMQNSSEKCLPLVLQAPKEYKLVSSYAL